MQFWCPFGDGSVWDIVVKKDTNNGEKIWYKKAENFCFFVVFECKIIYNIYIKISIKRHMSQT